MSAATDHYVTLDALKHARQQGTSTVADDEGNLAIAAAVDVIEQFTNRRFYPDTVTSDRKFTPVNSGLVLIDDLAEFDSFTAQSSTWVIEQDFYLEPLNAPAKGQPYTAIRTVGRPLLFTLADRQQGWAVFDGRVTVNGKWGFPTTPGAIQGAALLLASRYVTRFRTSPLGIYAGGGAEAAVVHLARWDPDVPAMLQSYAQTLFA